MKQIKQTKIQYHSELVKCFQKKHHGLREKYLKNGQIIIVKIKIQYKQYILKIY